MNGPVHTIIGTAAGSVVGLTAKDVPEDEQLWVFLAAVVGGALGGKMPDILEPSLNNPNHRQFCHSVAVLAVGGWLYALLRDWDGQSPTDRLVKHFIMGVLAGYGSHLGLDATTPRSLPLLGKLN